MLMTMNNMKGLREGQKKLKRLKKKKEIERQWEGNCTPKK